jgi:hypothetical protein
MADDLDRFLADNGLRMDHIATFVRGLHERTAKVDSHRTSPIHPQAAPPVAVQPPKRPEPRTRFLGGRLGRLLFGGPRAPRSQQGR